MKTTVVFFMAFVLGFTSGTIVKYNDCGSKTGKIIQVDAIPCPKEPCVVKKGNNVTIHVTFTTNSEATNATTVVHGIIAGIPAPFPAPCKDCSCGLTCPLMPGKNYTYTAALPVSKIYPSVDVIAKWELQDQNGADIWCFEIPVEIQ